MAWTRTYRPARIEDLHLESVRETLQSFLSSGRVPQALIFAGPKGTGKTTAARILAAVLNLPENENAVREQYRNKTATKKRQSLRDIGNVNSEIEQIVAGISPLVRELDAASNRGIDDIRQLKEAVHMPPPMGLVSVYILDEAHMLTQEAWNALLKLLEEPPSHAVFILATTELAKIPETIRSRCQLVQFHSASISELSQALGQVASLEKLSANKKALKLLSTASQGSFRDAIKLLEQAHEAHALESDSLDTLLALQTPKHYDELLRATLEKNTTAILAFFTSLRTQNHDESSFLSGFVGYLHELLIAAYSNEAHNGPASAEVILYLLTHLSQLPVAQNTPLPHLHLELLLLEMISRSKSKKKVTIATEKKDPQPKVSEPEATPSVKEKLVATTAEKLASGDAQLACEKWQQVVAALSEENFGLATLLRSTTAVSPEKHTIQIQVFYNFHKEQLEQPKFYDLLLKTLAQLSGGFVRVVVKVVETPENSELLETEHPLSKLAAQALM